MHITRRAVADGNWKKGRAWDTDPDMIVIHVTEGSAASVRSWFTDPAAQVSAHYSVNKDGTIDQFVDEKDTAYHAGRVDRATAPLVLLRPNVNPNAFSIGIEHEGSGTDPLTELQQAASVELIRDICTRRKIPMNRRHIVGHRQVFSKKTCPGAIDVDALVKALTVDRRRPEPFPPAQQPLIVYSDYFRDWLLVTRIISDTEWWFIPYTAVVQAGITPRRSTSPLHAMRRKMV